MAILRFFLFLTLSSSIWAAGSASAIPAADASIVGQLVQVLLALGFVLCLIVMAAWLMRRFSFAPGMAGKQMQVVSAVMVGQKERVVIVEVRDQWLVLGVTAQNVNLLSTLTKPEESAVQINTPVPFTDWLARTMQKRMKPTSNAPEQL